MKSGFWRKLRKPFFILAPMANVTDSAFRRMFAKYGPPDVFFTEFISCDGLCSEGLERLKVDLKYTENERPLVLQLFGSKPDNFYRCAQMAQEWKFDGIDINMGCPDRAVERQNAGAKLMKDPKLAQRIIAETIRGAGTLPVSVKTRLGYSNDILDEWLPVLLDVDLAAITIHARTRKEMSKGPAHWDRIKRAIELRDAIKSKTLIIGNGDVASLAQGQELAKQTGADGIMVGRGAFGNPWFFDAERPPESITPKEKLKALLEHTRLFEKMFGENKHFDIMKKHYKAYVSGWPEAKALRVKLMNVKSANEVISIVDKL
ncbi:MAG: tRNA-dihydrouridine synthase [Patescibacteria group bacterium]|jgi:nifR3 family TIM-barrel protein